MADAMEALRQDVEKESANELAGLEGHGLEALAPALTVILPSEGDAGLVGFDQAAVGDGDAVGVTREIGKNGTRAGKWSLAVDEPLGLLERSEIGGECPPVAELFVVAEEPELALAMRGAEPFQHQAAKERGEHPYWQEETGFTSNPPLAVEREAPTRHDHMDMGMEA